AVLNGVGWQGLRDFLARNFSSAMDVNGKKEGRKQADDTADGSHGSQNSRNQKDD
ncbi:MAG: hypothetical protein GX855_06785, partial [Firmicutes bacterium]|nr:hypothetical protein [Bacillota bacterium]